MDEEFEPKTQTENSGGDGPRRRTRVGANTPGDGSKRVPNAALLGKVDPEFIERASCLVNWLPYDSSASPDNIDFYIIDVSGPTNLGVVKCRWFNHERPKARLLVLLDSDSAIRHSGVVKTIKFTGILLKSAPNEILEQAITHVTAGMAFCDPDLKDIYPVVDVQKLGKKSAAPPTRRSLRLEVSETIEPKADAATEAATAKIRRAWFPPTVHSTTTVVLSFALNEERRPCKLTVLKPSGENLFEKAAFDALERVQLTELPVNGSFTISFCVETKLGISL